MRVIRLGRQFAIHPMFVLARRSEVVIGLFRILCSLSEVENENFEVCVSPSPERGEFR